MVSHHNLQWNPPMTYELLTEHRAMAWPPTEACDSNISTICSGPVDSSQSETWSTHKPWEIRKSMNMRFFIILDWGFSISMLVYVSIKRFDKKGPSSAVLSSRILKKSGNLKPMPLPSAWSATDFSLRADLSLYPSLDTKGTGMNWRDA